MSLQTKLLHTFQETANKNKVEKDKKKDDKLSEENIKLKKKRTEDDDDEEEEEIPQLVPMETPAKKPKLEVSSVHSCQK